MDGWTDGRAHGDVDTWTHGAADAYGQMDGREGQRSLPFKDGQGKVEEQSRRRRRADRNRDTTDGERGAESYFGTTNFHGSNNSRRGGIDSSRYSARVSPSSRAKPSPFPARLVVVVRILLPRRFHLPGNRRTRELSDSDASERCWPADRRKSGKPSGASSRRIGSVKIENIRVNIRESPFRVVLRARNVA